jgi:ElaA protein
VVPSAFETVTAGGYDQAMVLHHRLGTELTAQELHDILTLRVAVFVVEQACAYPEIDGRDLEPATTHRWLSDNQGIAAYLRTLAEPEGAIRIGRVVTRPDRRGEGLSGRLVQGVLADNPGSVTVLAAQSHLTAFYQRFGYGPDGPQFVEDGIPHTPMRRSATALLGGSGT